VNDATDVDLVNDGWYTLNLPLAVGAESRSTGSNVIIHEGWRVEGPPAEGSTRPFGVGFEDDVKRSRHHDERERMKTAHPPPTPQVLE
jgi:hypothetical protein